MPERLTLSLTAGSRKPVGAITVARRTLWGNPWAVGAGRGFNWPLPDPPEWGVECFIRAAPMTAEHCVATYRAWIDGDPLDRSVLPTGNWMEGALRNLAARRTLILSRLPDLRGRDLCCWCKPGCPCHADVLLEIANA